MTENTAPSSWEEHLVKSRETADEFRESFLNTDQPVTVLAMHAGQHLSMTGQKLVVTAGEMLLGLTDKIDLELASIALEANAAALNELARRFREEIPNAPEPLPYEQYIANTNQNQE